MIGGDGAVPVFIRPKLKWEGAFSERHLTPQKCKVQDSTDLSSPD